MFPSKTIRNQVSSVRNNESGRRTARTFSFPALRFNPSDLFVYQRILKIPINKSGLITSESTVALMTHEKKSKRSEESKPNEISSQRIYESFVKLNTPEKLTA